MASTYLVDANPTAGNRTKGTVSVWVKRGNLGGTQWIYTERDGSNNYAGIRFSSDGKLAVISRESSSDQMNVETNRVFRDTSAWYHIVVAWDTTDGTSSDRVKIYVNGVRETIFDGSPTYPSSSQNLYFGVGGTSYPIVIGRRGDNAEYFDGSMSHFHRVDNQSLDASTFGSTDSVTGEWTIKTSPSITYTGSSSFNFFVLKDGNSVTDQSGKGNNLTVGGGTLTKTEDNPSNNFATVNAVIGNHSNGNALQPTLENANTVSVYGSGEWRIAQSTLGASSGKYYAEIKWIEDSNTRYSYIGLYDVDGYAQKISGYPYMADMANCYGLKDSNGNINSGASSTSYGVSYGAGNIIGVAMDLDNNKLYFSKDGVWMNSANPSNGTGGYSITANKTYVIGIQQYAVGYLRFAHNYGNGYFQTTAVSSAGSNASNLGIFEYDVPTGFTALCTKGLNE